MSEERPVSREPGQEASTHDERRGLWNFGLPLLIIGTWHVAQDLFREIRSPGRVYREWIVFEVVLTLAGLTLVLLSRRGPAKISILGSHPPSAAVAVVGAAVAAVLSVVMTLAFGRG